VPLLQVDDLNSPTMSARIALPIASAMKPSLIISIDKHIRIAQSFAFPIRVWYSIASFIGFVLLCHFASLHHFWMCRPPCPPVHNWDVIHSWRLPGAIGDTFCVVAFQWTIGVGDFYTISLAEIFSDRGI
jgi:hypothetical protein